MEKIANLDLPSFSDRVLAEVVAAIQAELTATIDDLANSVRHLILGNMRGDREARSRRVATATTSPETFDALIERAARLLVVSSTGEVDKASVEKLHQQAINYMIKAARSPFFGGTETTVSYEGLAVVREEVFARVSDELIRRGYNV
jgi:hypothetical protein